MPEIIREMVTTQESVTPVVVSAKASSTQRMAYLIYFIFGALDVLLVFRLVLKFMGASTASAFVRGIYSVSSIFIWPFEGIFRRGISEGIETVSVLEPATIVALIVYAVLSWGLVRLLEVLSGEQTVE